MKRPRRAELAEIREDLRKRLFAALSGSPQNPKLIAELVSHVSAVDLLSRQQQGGDKKQWHLPVFIAAIAIGLVGIASLIRLPRIRIDLDATASEFQIRLDASHRSVGGALTFTPGTFMSNVHRQDVDGESAVAHFAQFTGLQRISLAAASVVTLSSKPGRCYELRVQTGELQGALVRRGAFDGDAVPWPEKITIAAPGFLRFCSSNELALFVDGVDGLSLSATLRSFPPPELHAPSIAKGEIRIASTDDRRALTDHDRLSLAGIRDGKLAVRFGDALKLSFFGSVSHPMLFGLSGPSSSGGTDLRPTLAGLATSSPQLTAIFASVVGVATTLMGAMRWFKLHAEG